MVPNSQAKLARGRPRSKFENNIKMYLKKSGPDSSLGIATDYGLDGPGIESRCGGEIFRTCPDRPWGPPSLLYNGYWVISGGGGVKVRPGRGADH